jgi:phytoene desaturase
VIGAGFGGLAAAVRLQAAGVQTTVLEANDQPGGRAGQITAAGFTFDAGPTVVTAPHLLRELFAVAGARLQDHVRLVPLEPFYRVCFADGSHVDYGSAGAALDAQLEAIEPGAAQGMRRFMAHTARLYRRGFLDLGTADFSSLRTFLGVVPDLAQLRADRSVYQLAARYFRDERLRILFSFHPLFIGGNPRRTTSIYGLVPYLEQVGGVHYALGGTHAIVQALANVFGRLGGRLELNAPVAEIVVEAAGVPGARFGSRAPGRANGVRTEDGRRWPASIVVSNADVLTTYRRLVPAAWRRRWTDAALDRLQLSMGCYLLYLGLNRRYPQLRHHTIVMPGDYAGVLGDLFDRRVLPREAALYVHTPARTDPSVAPPGGETMYVLAPVPHLDGRIDWQAEAPRLRERILTFLEERLGLAGLRDAIVVERQRTPLDFRDHLRSERGAAFSLQPLLLQSAYFRPHNRSEDVAALYVAGAGAHPGAGVPGVLLSAQATVAAALRDLGYAGHAAPAPEALVSAEVAGAPGVMASGRR